MDPKNVRHGEAAPLTSDESGADELARLRNELSEARKQARSAVAARDAELASVRAENETLQASNKAKDEFLAMVGHELRNPLAPIATVLQLLRLRDEAALKDERAVLERHFAHLVLLVEDLLDAGRITAGRMVLKKERIELSELVARAVELTGPMLARLRHELRIELPATGLAVDVDAQRLTQVLTNLMTNAAKLTESGGAVVVAGAKERGTVVLRLRFERFVQGTPSANRSVGSLGLGFTVVEKLVALHGGTIAIETDASGQGAEFRIELPAAARTLMAVPDLDAEDELEPPAPAERRTRVLIVDDNEDTADMLSYLMEELGYSTRVAHDGMSALQIAAEEPPDVALLDLRLPVMDGFQLAAQMRKQPALKHTKLIAVTGYGQDSHRQKTAEAGFDAHLVKPIEAHQLVETINQLVAPPA